MKKTRKLIAVLFSTMLILSMSMQSFAATKYFTISGDLLGTIDYSRTSSSVNLELKIVKNSAGYNMYNGSIKTDVHYINANGKYLTNNYSDSAYTSEKASAKIVKSLPGSEIYVVNTTATIYNKTLSFSY